MDLIKLIDINKSFGDNIIFQKLNLEFKKNNFNCILAESGRGKTTLLHILMGLDKDFSGKILGLDENISPIFQENRLLENYSIYDNINLVLEEELSSSVINSYLEKINLNIDSTTIISNLSGGMKRRIAILRSILKPADVYIFDEPFKDMDLENHLIVLEFIKSELEGRTVIFSSHSRLDLDILKPYIIDLDKID